MKKMLSCLVCMFIICAGAVAQNRQGNNNRQNNGRQFQHMSVIDTAIINHMGLSEELLSQVLALQAKQQNMAKEQMSNMMSQRNQRMSEVDRKGMAEKMVQMKATFRKELRELIGVDNYIAYLEKQIDTPRPAFGGRQMQMNGQGGQGQRGNWGGQGGYPRGGNRGGFGGNQGGFDGGANDGF